jgi:hypothetical protein
MAAPLVALAAGPECVPTFALLDAIHALVDCLPLIARHCSPPRMYKSFWRPSGSCDLSLVLRGGGGRLRRRPARAKGRGDEGQQAGGVVGVHPVPRVGQHRHAVPQPRDLRLVAAAPAR